MRKDSQGRLLYDQICEAKIFAEAITEHFDFITCVPDSIFRNVLPHIPEWEYAPRENHAISMGFGARIGGKNVAIMMQNSGLGLALDAILGTFELYQQGCLIVISNRGQLEWEEIQHQQWGKITEDLLRSSRIEQVRFHEIGPDGIGEIAKKIINDRKVVALTMQRGNLNE